MFPYTNKFPYNDTFTNKITSSEEYLQKHSMYADAIYPQKQRYEINDHISFKGIVGSHSDPSDGATDGSIEGTIIDIAPYGGYGGLRTKNGTNFIDQDILYRIKLATPHNFYIEGIITDDVVILQRDLYRAKKI